MPSSGRRRLGRLPEEEENASECRKYEKESPKAGPQKDRSEMMGVIDGVLGIGGILLLLRTFFLPRFLFRLILPSQCQ